MNNQAQLFTVDSVKTAIADIFEKTVVQSITNEDGLEKITIGVVSIDPIYVDTKIIFWLDTVTHDIEMIYKSEHAPETKTVKVHSLEELRCFFHYLDDNCREDKHNRTMKALDELVEQSEKSSESVIEAFDRLNSVPLI